MAVLALETRGYKPVPSKGKGFWRQESYEPMTVVGVSSIRVNLGDYRSALTFFFLFITNVTAFWGFDAEGKLIDIWVWKTTDAL